MSLVFVNVPSEAQYDEIRACRGCLATGVDLHDLHGKIAQVFSEITTMPVKPSDGYPQYICSWCRKLVCKFLKFRMRFHSAVWILEQMRYNKGTITEEKINSIDRTHLKLNYTQSDPYITSYLPENEIDINIENNLPKLDTEIENIDSKSDKSVFNITFEDDDGINNEETFEEIDEKKHFEEENVSQDIKEEIEESTQQEDESRTNKRTTRKRKAKKEIIKDHSHSEKLPRKRKRKEKDIKKSTRKTKEQTVEKEMIVKNEIDIETDENLKNAKLFYNSHPSKEPSNEELKKRLEMIEKFSKNYNVAIRFLSKEEQRRELEERKNFYKNLPYTCDICYRGFSFEAAYRTHMTVHDPATGDFVCDICGIRSKTHRDREKHINATHLKRFTCKQCGIVTKSQSYAKAHFARHRGATYSCDQCGKTFGHQTNYLGHMRSAHESRATRCAVCGDALLGRLGLSVHMGIVHKQATSCSSCDTVFHNAECLHKHLECSPDNGCPPGVKPCPMCGTNFPSEKLMKKHYDEEHNKELKCELCNKILSTKLKYSIHMHEHKKAEQTVSGGIICEVCGKSKFKNLTQLRTHQRLHTGEKPYKCTLCPKTFRLTTLLKSHMVIHTDERRYKCPQCPKAFHQNAHRTAHLLTHTKQRPYACYACPKRYTSATAAKEHADTVHRGLPARRRDKKDT